MCWYYTQPSNHVLLLGMCIMYDVVLYEVYKWCIFQVNTLVQYKYSHQLYFTNSILSVTIHTYIILAGINAKCKIEVINLSTEFKV